MKMYTMIYMFNTIVTEKWHKTEFTSPDRPNDDNLFLILRNFRKYCEKSSVIYSKQSMRNVVASTF